MNPVYTEIVATHFITKEVLKFKHVPDTASFFNMAQEDILLALQGKYRGSNRVKGYLLEYRRPYFHK